MRQGYIYFFRTDGGHNYVKIGRSANPRARLDALSGEAGHRLAVIGIMLSDDVCVEEGEIHRAFAVHRRHGEWFDGAVVDLLAPYRGRFLLGFPDASQELLSDEPELPPKTQRIELRVADIDLRSWRKAAAQEKRTLSEWIRHACDERSANGHGQP